MRKLIIVALFFLGGCDTTNQSPDLTASSKKAKHHLANTKNKTNRYSHLHDGPPLKHGKISFKEPVPMSEPLSHYGNPSEYSVEGHSYRVMTSSTGYKMRGIASWYGTKFHKQRTSSGEPYDMYQMSAAHKTLPIPTYIRVRNLNNGKVAVVKVNDRGPFHSDRIIDLSFAAALKLGVFPKGTAPVEIETLAGPIGKGYYYVQAGAFLTKSSANRLKEKLNHIIPSPVCIEEYNQRYLVKVGPFGSKYLADDLKRKLARNGINGSFSILA